MRRGYDAAYAARMQRVLLVCLPSDPDDQTFGVAARALRDAGHEIVHGGAIGSAGQIAAVAFQEDVDVVLLIGGEEADGVAAELVGSDEDPQVRVVRPGVSRVDVAAAVAR